MNNRIRPWQFRLSEWSSLKRKSDREQSCYARLSELGARLSELVTCCTCSFKKARSLKRVASDLQYKENRLEEREGDSQTLNRRRARRGERERVGTSIPLPRIVSKTIIIGISKYSSLPSLDLLNFLGFILTHSLPQIGFRVYA